MFRRASLIAAALALLFTAQGAAAGSLALTPSITLGGSYDSNVRYTGEETADDDSDFIATAAPELRLAGKWPRAALGAGYRLTADYYTKNPELNTVSHEAHLDVDISLSKTVDLGIGDSFVYSKDSLKAVETGILVVRTDILSNTAYISLGKKITPRTSLALDLRDSVIEYDDELLVDSRADSAGLTGEYMHSKTGATRLTYMFTDYRFEGLEEDRDLDSHLVRLGIRESVTPTLTADISGGLVYMPDLDGDDFFIVAAAGFEKAFKDSTLKLAYARDIATPSGLAAEIAVYDSISFEYKQLFDRYFDFTVFGGFAKNRTEPSGTVDVNSAIAGVTGRWKPYLWMEVAAGLEHFQQWTRDTLGEGLTRNRVFLNVTFIGPEWRT